MDVFLGTIMIFGGNFAPQGWAFCQGQILPVAQNAALYSLLGTFYGGNGTTTFALPNLQGRVAIGMGSGGAGTYTIGQTGGNPQVTLTINNLPTHTHMVNAQSEPATTASPANAFPAQPGSKGTPGPLIYGQGSANTTMASGMISLAGGNQPVSILPPYLALNYIIALVGIYPSRS